MDFLVLSFPRGLCIRLMSRRDSWVRTKHQYRHFTLLGRVTTQSEVDTNRPTHIRSTRTSQLTLDPI